MSSFNIYQCIFVMFVGGLIGWVTNWIAVKALFWPKNKKKFLWIEYQGLVPKRHLELADNVGKLVDGELLNTKMLVGMIKPEDIEPIVKSMASSARKDVEERLKKGLADYTSKIPFFTFSADGFINSAMDKAEQEIVSAINKQLPDVIESAGKKICDRFSVQKLVTEKIASMDIMKVEDLFNAVANREMKAIVHLGGIIGAVVGALQYVIQILCI